MCIAIPRKYPVASVIGFLKGKSAIAMARLCGKERNFTGEHFWARGYAVSTVGFELEQVRKYIRAPRCFSDHFYGKPTTGRLAEGLVVELPTTRKLARRLNTSALS